MKIEAQSIHFKIDQQTILKDINMTAHSGKFIGIIGPNGSGKSTLLKCIYRVLKPNDGVVFLNGKPLQSMKPKESAKQLAVVAQHHVYSFDFTVEEMVLMGRAPYKKSMQREDASDYEAMRSALQKVGMEAFAKRQFASLSGGEQQRVIVARALAQQAACIILDEPTNHLDIKYQLQLMDLVKSLEITVIAAIHDLNIASMYCDQIYALKEGEVIAQGTPEEVVTEPFIKAVYDVEAKIIRDAGDGLTHILYKPGYL